MTYCEFVRTEKAHPVHRLYHDTAYGFPLENDDALFGRLILEINQAGLSWETILKKQESFREAYDSFSVEKIANYGDGDVVRLLSDPGIIRNRLKVAAAVHNARVILGIQDEFGSFSSWLDAHHPKTKPEWVALFKKTFQFTGGEIVGEFLMSCGYLDGAHDPDCPTRAEILAKNPPFCRG